MPSDSKYDVLPRPEADLRHQWGLRSNHDGKWLPIAYTTKRDAEEAARVLSK